MKGAAAANAHPVDNHQWSLPGRMSGAMSGHLLQARFLQRWHRLRWQPDLSYCLSTRKNIPQKQCHLQTLILIISHGRSHCETPCNRCVRPVPALPTLHKACHRSSTISTQVLLVFSQSDNFRTFIVSSVVISHSDKLTIIFLRLQFDKRFCGPS